MEAVLFDGAGRGLRLDRLDDPMPAADGLVIDIAACGICGSDLHMSEDPATFGIGPGAVLGHEFAGTVVATGVDVTGFAAGDRVAVAPMVGCGTCERCRSGDPAWCPKMRLIGGGYAGRAAVTARQCRHLPDTLPTAEGALAEPTAVGLHCVNRARVRTGDRVLILGGGPIGLLVAYWARRRGAAVVAVADLSAHPRDKAMAVGATHFLHSDDALGAAFGEAAGGPPDIVFECVGKRGLIGTCVSLVRTQGRVIGVGLCVGGDDWDPFAAMHKEAELIFAAFFQMAEFEAALSALADGGRFRPQALVTDRIGLDAVPRTFEALKTRTTQCKVLITA